MARLNQTIRHSIVKSSKQSYSPSHNPYFSDKETEAQRS